MVLLFFVTLCWQHDPIEPIDVQLGDQVIDIEVLDINGKSFHLKDLFSDGFCVFLATECGKCIEALPTIDKLLAKEYPCVLLIQGTPSVDIPKDFDRLGKQQNCSLFFVQSKTLKELNIKSLPAVLGYQNGLLVLGYHGSIYPENAKILLRMMAVKRAYK